MKHIKCLRWSEIAGVTSYNKREIEYLKKKGWDIKSDKDN